MENKVYQFMVCNPNFINFNVKWNYEANGDMYVSVPGYKLLFDDYPWTSKDVEFFHKEILVSGLRLSWSKSMKIIYRLMKHKETGKCAMKTL